jgi:hypothetical protein
MMSWILAAALGRAHAHARAARVGELLAAPALRAPPAGVS